jgi:two-component system LytT family response regulator
MNQLIRTIIVDDEQNSREVLVHLLSEHPQIKVVDEAKNAEEAFQKISNKNPDLVFLDIQMPKGDGFSLLKKFSQINFEIIFVTSFDQYAINAVKVSALDYLLKPIITDELDLAIEKARKHLTNKHEIQDKINALIERLQKTHATQKISVHLNGQVKLLAFNDILMVEASGRYATITNFDGRTYTTAKNLKDIEEELKFNRIFLRLNKSHLVNINGVSAYSKTRSCFITLVNGYTIEVSRRKKAEIVAVLSAKSVQVAK